MVYVLLAEGFEEVEALTPADLLRRSKVDVKLAGVTGMQVTGSHGITVSADIPLDEADFDSADMVILPGGMPGTKNLYADERVKKAVRKLYDENKYVAAICAAPSIILGGMGLLKGRRATCFPGMEDGMTGAECIKQNCVVDGKIITGCGVGGALDFGCAIVEAICGKEQAEKVSASVVHNVYR